MKTMKTQNLNLFSGLEAIELTNGQMEVITGGTSTVASKKAPPKFEAGLTAKQGASKVTKAPPKKK
jgi:hypothetical protein